MTGRADIDLSSLKAQLVQRKRDIERVMGQSEESLAPVELDQTMQGRLSRMDAMQQQEMAKETQRRREIDLQRTEGALKRIETDDYGYCMKCDEEIEVKRLELDPAVLTCVSCASKI